MQKLSAYRKNNQLANKSRSTGAFRSAKEEKRYWLLLIILLSLALLASYGLLVYKNPVAVTSPSFLPIVKRRTTALTAMVIAALCQSLSTVAFQSITTNRVITPSLLGFEALYVSIHTATMFFFGVTAFVGFTGLVPFIIQVVAMVSLCLLLYGWLLSGKYGDLQLMLLVGVIIGSGLRSLSSFMKRILTPSEYDLLQARLLGSVNNADADYFPIAIPIVVLAVILLFVYSKRLNVVALGKDVCQTLGVRYQASVIFILVIVAVLMSISTALVGQLTFFGFLVATLAYQAAPTYDHKYVFPMAFVIGYVIITVAYFFMYHVFNAQGVVSVIIEIFGGLTFLIVVLRKGSL